jgi:hypothetical protein
MGIREARVGSHTVTTAATPRRGMYRLGCLCALALLLAGCSTLSRNTVAINESVDPRLDVTMKNGLFTTKARIGSLEASPFVIDTGADQLYLDSELAKVLNPSSWGEHDSRGTRPKVKWGVLASFDLGRVTLKNTVVGVMDFSAASLAFEERLAGLLGYPFFAKAVVEVNYPQGSISCFDPKTYRLSRGVWQPLTLIGNRPALTARLEGNIEGQYLLDTGNTSTVLFFPEFVQKHALLDNRQVRRVKHVSVLGERETLAGRIAWFEFAGHRFEKPIVQFDLQTGPHASQARLAGVIGRGFLREFVVVFNYPESKIALLPK